MMQPEMSTSTPFVTVAVVLTVSKIAMVPAPEMLNGFPPEASKTSLMTAVPAEMAKSIAVLVLVR